MQKYHGSLKRLPDVPSCSDRQEFKSEPDGPQEIKLAQI